MTVWLPVECPHCQSTEVVKHGKSVVGKQRYRCVSSHFGNRLNSDLNFTDSNTGLK